MKRRKHERRSMAYQIMGPGERRRGEDQRSGFWGTNKQPEKTDLFGNDRFWEYVDQIKLDGHDPADVLETFLAKHNPDFFKGGAK